MGKVVGSLATATLALCSWALLGASPPPAPASMASTDVASNGAMTLRFPWNAVMAGSWQIDSPNPENPETTDLREGTRGQCGPGMVEVQGKMKQHALMEFLQNQACTQWISKTFPERCGAFDRAQWLGISQALPSVPMHFCIDRFEYPNRQGAYPIVEVTWYEARDRCKSEGKRLCSEDEWTFACEGDEAAPYPTGYSRDANACVIDRPWILVDELALMPRSGDRARREIDRLWQGEPSGTHAACKSPFGVHDMTGNVDEWTRSSVYGERPSVLKGGYWGPVRTRCRPATKAHGEGHAFYQQGFRCCADEPGKTPLK